MAMRRGGFRWEEKKGWRDKEGSFVKILGDSSRGKSMIPMGEKGGKSNSEPPGEKLVEGRRLTQAELQERMEGQEDGEPAETEEDGDPAETEEPILELEHKTLQLSLKSKEGLTSRKSFKIKGTIGGREVLILIDSGATGNFISQPLVAELQLQVTKTPEYTVEMGNGQKEKNKGICKAVQIEMQGVRIEQDFFILNLGGTEVVLGLDWLASLGDIEANFKNFTLQWGKRERKQILKGDPALCKEQASWKTMIKTLHAAALPAESLIHPVFHVSLLKKLVSNDIQTQPLPKCLTEDWELNVQPAEALAIRQNQQGIMEVLIKWHQLPECENSWETLTELQEQFPGFHLGDKVCLDRKGDDTAQQKRPKVKYMYRRRYRGDAANQDPGGEK
ncbi:Chromo-like domain superfamily [Sesbania bispinosa]|nr:Chromo-like domain superfamily [Sesbania bispinosa]